MAVDQIDVAYAVGAVSAGTIDVVTYVSTS